MRWLGIIGCVGLLIGAGWMLCADVIRMLDMPGGFGREEWRWRVSFFFALIFGAVWMIIKLLDPPIEDDRP
ncbi:MAG: hypothetical protein JNK63_07010 [Chthonomonas sp.]|nr:hypothetical protein [Chthonomonas sp.]